MAGASGRRAGWMNQAISSGRLWSTGMSPRSCGLPAAEPNAAAPHALPRNTHQLPARHMPPQQPPCKIDQEHDAWHTRMIWHKLPVAEKSRCYNMPSPYSTRISRLVRSSELTSRRGRARSFALLSAMRWRCCDGWASSLQPVARFHSAPASPTHPTCLRA